MNVLRRLRCIIILAYNVWRSWFGCYHTKLIFYKFCLIIDFTF